MIHYHGTPFGSTRQDTARFLAGRHALVPYPRQDDMGIVAAVCQSFAFDNGAFTIWKQGGALDTRGYLEWVKAWCQHPGFEWALIPDIIEGSEEENDALVEEFQAEGGAWYGVPVWHLHESIGRLERLCCDWPRVALGSSGQWATPGTKPWWNRISAAMDAITDEQGRPITKLHGLRIMDPRIFTRLPLASADSTNAAVNSGSISRFGCYLPPTSAQRGAVIADRIEAENSAPVWLNYAGQGDLFD
ncbi:MAG: hypothetical protein IPN92_17080 [Chromatiaceae bacterium]|nr:hypothetical protein [Chromatiaceae bacterium]